MKQFHEVGVMRKESGTPTGFLLVSKDDILDARKLYYKNVKYVSFDEMVELVKNDKIQYFVYDSEKNEITISYTQEEIEEIKRYNGKASVDLVKSMKDMNDYLDNDVIFSSEQYDMFKDRGFSFATLITVINMPFALRLLGVILYGANEFGKLFNNWYNSKKDSIKAKLTPVSIGNNMVLINVLEDVYEEMASELNVLTYVSMFKRKKLSGLVGLVQPSVETFEEIRINMDNINKSILHNIC